MDSSHGRSASAFVLRGSLRLVGGALLAGTLLISPARRSHAQELVATTSVSPVPLASTERAASSPRASSSASHGLPWDGELRNGAWLSESTTLRHLPRYRSGDNFYGTAELVGMLRRVGESVARVWAGSRLTVGELSAKQGGWIEGHHSHRNGRDVDIAFFMRSRSGRLMPFWRFVSFGRSGPERAIDSHLRFDDSRNWAVVAEMLRDPEARIQYIFVARPIRARLLVEGRNRGESAEFLRKAAAVMIEPQHGHRHENHFHVRLYCARDDRPQCEDRSPYWPWFDGASPEGAYTELPIIRWRPTRASTPTTDEGSVAEAPAQHPATESSTERDTAPPVAAPATVHATTAVTPNTPSRMTLVRPTAASAPLATPHTTGG